jgi:hypothetical protein
LLAGQTGSELDCKKCLREKELQVDESKESPEAKSTHSMPNPTHPSLLIWEKHRVQLFLSKPYTRRFTNLSFSPKGVPIEIFSHASNLKSHAKTARVRKICGLS